MSTALTPAFSLFLSQIARHWLYMGVTRSPRGQAPAVRQARARTIWSSSGLVRVVARSPARSVLAHPLRRARTRNGLFGRAGRGQRWMPQVEWRRMARERRRVAHARSYARGSARARGCVRRRLLRERRNDLCQASFGAAGFRRPPARRSRLRQSHATAGERRRLAQQGEAEWPFHAPRSPRARTNT